MPEMPDSPTTSEERASSAEPANLMGNIIPSSPLDHTPVEPTRPQALVFNAATGEFDANVTLLAGDQIPGWRLGLEGCGELPEEIPESIWAKLRRALRLQGMDAVALFKVDDSFNRPSEMTIIPETSILNGDLAFADYVRNLARVLSKQTLPQFAAFLVKAQALSQSGKSTAEIIAKLFPQGFERNLIDISSMTIAERKKLRRRICKGAKTAYKTAAKEAKAASALAKRLRVQAERAQRDAETADDDSRAMLQEDARRCTKLARRAEETADETKRRKWQTHAYYDQVRRTFRANRLMEGEEVQLTSLELSELLASDDAPADI